MGMDMDGVGWGGVYFWIHIVLHIGIWMVRTRLNTRATKNYQLL